MGRAYESKFIAPDASHQLFGTWVEVNDLHHRTDCMLRIKVGIRRLSKKSALQHSESAALELPQHPLMLFVIIKEETKMLHALASAVQELFVTGLTRQVLNKLDLGVS